MGQSLESNLQIVKRLIAKEHCPCQSELSAGVGGRRETTRQGFLSGVHCQLDLTTAGSRTLRGFCLSRHSEVTATSFRGSDSPNVIFAIKSLLENVCRSWFAAGPEISKGSSANEIHA